MDAFDAGKRAKCQANSIGSTFAFGPRKSPKAVVQYCTAIGRIRPSKLPFGALIILVSRRRGVRGNSVQDDHIQPRPGSPRAGLIERTGIVQAASRVTEKGITNSPNVRSPLGTPNFRQEISLVFCSQVCRPPGLHPDPRPAALTNPVAVGSGGSRPKLRENSALAELKLKQFRENDSI